MTPPLEITRFDIGDSDYRYRFSIGGELGETIYSMTAPLSHSFIPLWRYHSCDVVEAIEREFPSTRLVDTGAGFALFMSYEDRVALELRATRH